MKQFKKIIVLVVFLSVTTYVHSQEIWTAGPMLHVNFGGEKTNVSYGFEVAYWNITHFYYGVDGGIEYGVQHLRIYSELETGLGVVGFGLGPVLEFKTNKSQINLGFQYTIWANYFLGLDYRHRNIDSTNYNCVGFYLKVPYKTTGLDNSNSNNTTTTSHHHWDWD